MFNFTKMHGLGNDFIFVDQKEIQNIEVAALAKKICNRRFGIGADQLIIYNINDVSEAIANISMIIYNIDGSHAKACGNASRCLMMLIKDKCKVDNININVDGRNINAIVRKEPSQPNLYCVNMGAVNFDANWIPAKADLIELAKRYNIPPKEVICADIGNPHLVIFSELNDVDKKVIGKQMQESSLFPDGVNVNFVNLQGGQIHLKVYERGSGFTFACGSGAAASFASALKLGHAEGSADVVFEKGSLKMEYDNGDILMTGPANYICSGVYHYE